MATPAHFLLGKTHLWVFSSPSHRRVGYDNMCQVEEVSSDLDMISHLMMSSEKVQEVLFNTKEEDILENDL